MFRPCPVSTRRRITIAILGLAISAQAIALCGLTGWAAFTRFPSHDLERMNSDTSLERAFSATGLNDRLGEMGKIDSRFALGWLPEATLGGEALSVTTLGGPGLLVALIALWPRKKPWS